MAALPGHTFHASILREYDVRGIVGETLSTADAGAVGRAFGTIVRREGGTGTQRICLGYDGRLSSPEFEEAVAEGLASAGVDVLRIGRGPTPMLYFAVHHLGADGGIQVTGSHNPPDHNGFKMMLGKRSFFGERIQELGIIAREGAWASGRGQVRDVPVSQPYVDRLVQDFRPGRQLSVVWDAGNGATGDVLRDLTARLPGRHTLLYDDIDGRFPNHHPDPTIPENLVDLQAELDRQGAEVGIAFDGDGDRIGVVDSKGRILFGDQLLQILAAEVLAKPEYAGKAIIADVKASQALFERIGQLGGVPDMFKTGHSLIKNRMVELNSPLAGEMSGHIFYADGFYGHDDALYVAIRLLSILAAGGRTLDAWRDGMKSMVNTPELRFECADARKFHVIDEVRRRLAASGAEVNGIDGVRVRSGNGWWLLRASNTQAVLVARAEADDAAALEELKDQIRAQLVLSGIDPPAF